MSYRLINKMKFYSAGVILIFYFLFPFYGKAQGSREGFIVTPDGQYQYGVLQPGGFVHHECTFKAVKTTEFVKYTPEQILGYGLINGIRYVTKTIDVNAAQIKVFLKKEDDVSVPFYTLNDSRFFYEKNSFTELKAENYKDVLSEDLKTCEKVLPAIRKADFDLSSLKKIFAKYNSCVNPHTGKVKRRILIHADLLAGLEVNKILLIANPATVDRRSFSPKDQTLLSVGAITAFLVGKNKNIGLVTCAYYYKQQTSQVRYSQTASYRATDLIKFRYNEVLIPVGIYYSIGKLGQNVKPYFKVGIFIPVTSKSSLTWQNEKEYYNAAGPSTVVFSDYDDLPQKFAQSLQFGVSAGTTFSFVKGLRNVIELTYQKGNGKLVNENYRVEVESKRFIISLGIRF